jgi:phage major head subunit gpT-like protein
MATVIDTGLLTRETHFGDWCTRIESTKGQENYRWLGTVPQVREWGTGRVAKGLRAESYDVVNRKYESTLEVDRDEISDDQTGQIRIRIAELAQRAATHKDYMIGTLLANGHSAGYLSYDGQIFFSAAHVSGASGTQDNDLTNDIADKDAPTTAEMKTNIQLAIGQMLTFKDDQGAPMMLNLAGLVVVVPPNMLFAAMEAANATIIANTSNVIQGMMTVASFPWLTTTDTWFLLKTDGIVRPFIFQDREPIEFSSLAEGSEEDFRREKFLYGIRARYRVTYGYWQYAVRTIFTTT